jgi:N-acetyl-gamma-glutamyl-phosphate reductase
MLDVAILNVTGYAGLSAAQLLANHPVFSLVAVSGRSEVGRKLADVFPLWAGDPGLRIEATVPAVDVVFSALPHGASASAVIPLHAAGSKIVDLSADFRLRDPSTYAEWYGDHPAPSLLAEAVYGMPEWRREQLRGASLVGNPGCYPTASILSLAPALEADIVEPRIIIDAVSGVSGSGRGLSLGNHFSETNESVRAYAEHGHRHAPEIEQELTCVAHQPVEIVFTVHLAPMTRGMHVTCFAPLKMPISSADILNLYRTRYRDEPFVRVLDEPPATKWVSGTNSCFIYPIVNRRGTHLIVYGVIDNLIKGAAGQAIQNANVMSNLPETAGLVLPASFP